MIATLTFLYGFIAGIVATIGLCWYVVYSDDEEDFDCKNQPEGKPNV